MSTDGNYKENKKNQKEKFCKMKNLRQNWFSLEPKIYVRFVDDDKIKYPLLSNLKTLPRNENLKKNLTHIMNSCIIGTNNLLRGLQEPEPVRITKTWLKMLDRQKTFVCGIKTSSSWIHNIVKSWPNTSWPLNWKETIPIMTCHIHGSTRNRWRCISVCLKNLLQIPSSRITFLLSLKVSTFITYGNAVRRFQNLKKISESRVRCWLEKVKVKVNSANADTKNCLSITTPVWRATILNIC